LAVSADERNSEVHLMSVSGISSGAGSTPLSYQALRSEVSQDFNTIASSLQSNNIASAQQAYADIVQLTQGGNAAAGGTLGKDFANLGAALQSGNVGSAQAAFSQFQTDAATQAQTSGTEGHHHHHHGGAASSATTGTSSTTASAGSSSGTSLLGSLFQIGLNFLK
jgi:hypothetical protein